MKEDIPEFWARVVEMQDDDDVAVRRQVSIKSCGEHDLLIMSFNVRWVTVWYKVMMCVHFKMLRCVTRFVMVHQLTWKMKWRGLCKGESRQQFHNVFSFW